MTSSSPCFPAEINFLIIDQLAQADDTATLLSCSLVCRSWLPAARARLFGSIKVVTAANGRLDAFANFLARCRDVCPLIRDLTLSCEPAARAEDKRVPERLSWPHFRTVVFMLPRLHSLTLNGISIVPGASSWPGSDSAARPTLHSLRMTGCQLHDLDMTSALDVLRIFSRVDNLSFGGFWSMAHTRPLPAIATRSTMIRRVHCDSLGAQAAQFFCYFLGPPRGDPLRSIHLTWYSWAEVEAYRSFLNGHAQTLKHLELEPTDEFWTRRISKFSLWAAFGDILSKSAQLESLCLHARCGYLSHAVDSARCLSAILDVYESLLSRGPPLLALRKLTLKIPIYPKGTSDDRSWNAMFRAGDAWRSFDAALTAVQSLTLVVLELQTPGSLALDASVMDESALLVRRALPQVDAKGILRIGFTVCSGRLDGS